MIPELPGDDRKPGPRPPRSLACSTSDRSLPLLFRANQSKTSRRDATAWNGAGERRRRSGQVITSTVITSTDDNDDNINNDNTFSQIQKKIKYNQREKKADVLCGWV